MNTFLVAVIACAGLSGVNAAGANAELKITGVKKHETERNPLGQPVYVYTLEDRKAHDCRPVRIRYSTLRKHAKDLTKSAESEDHQNKLQELFKKSFPSKEIFSRKNRATIATERVDKLNNWLEKLQEIDPAITLENFSRLDIDNPDSPGCNRSERSDTLSTASCSDTGSETGSDTGSDSDTASDSNWEIIGFEEQQQVQRQQRQEHQGLFQEISNKFAENLKEEIVSLNQNEKIVKKGRKLIAKKLTEAAKEYEKYEQSKEMQQGFVENLADNVSRALSIPDHLQKFADELARHVFNRESEQNTGTNLFAFRRRRPLVASDYQPFLKQLGAAIVLRMAQRETNESILIKYASKWSPENFDERHDFFMRFRDGLSQNEEFSQFEIENILILAQGSNVDEQNVLEKNKPSGPWLSENQSRDLNAQFPAL